MSDEATVKTLFAAAGIDAADDLAFIVGTYPILQALVGVLYSVEAARYESPGLVFDPDPRFLAWD